MAEERYPSVVGEIEALFAREGACTMDDITGVMPDGSVIKMWSLGMAPDYLIEEIDAGDFGDEGIYRFAKKRVSEGREVMDQVLEGISAGVLAQVMEVFEGQLEAMLVTVQEAERAIQDAEERGGLVWYGARGRCLAGAEQHLGIIQDVGGDNMGFAINIQRAFADYGKRHFTVPGGEG